jgi:GTP-binding protein EngB required for normal cell division
MESEMTDDMISIIEKAGVYDGVMNSVMDKIAQNISHRQLGNMKTSVIMFSNVYQILGVTPRAKKTLEKIRKEYKEWSI